MKNSGAISGEDFTKEPWTGLHLAAHFGITNAVRLMFNQPSFNQEIIDNRAPPWWATANEPDPALKGCHGSNPRPLKLAAKRGHEAVVRILLEKGAEAKRKDGSGHTALHHAARKGHLDVARALLDCHPGCATINALTEEVYSQAWNIPPDPYLHASRSLLHRWSEDVEPVYEYQGQSTTKRTALHLAIEGRYEALATLLLLRRASTGQQRTTETHIHNCFIKYGSEMRDKMSMEPRTGWMVGNKHPPPYRVSHATTLELARYYGLKKAVFMLEQGYTDEDAITHGPVSV